jgi:hypothetical protein
MKVNSLLKKGKIYIYIFLVLLVVGCCTIACMFPHNYMIMEGLVNTGGTVTSNNGNPLSSGVNLSNIANMTNVACSKMWASLNADSAGYTMVNALQTPDGSCVVDFMDTDGLFYTETWTSQNNGNITVAPNNTAGPTVTTTPAKVAGVIQSGQRSSINEIQA